MQSRGHRRWLYETADSAKKSGLLINVTTNGSLILKNLDLIKYLDYITISIDSHIGDIHDKIRGLPGLSNKIIEGIKAISHLKKGPIINIRGIVTKANASDIGEYINYWKDKTDQILFQPIHQSPHIGFKTPQEFLKHNKPKDRKVGIATKRCRRCQRVGGHVGKYGLNLCRHCFREIATKIGFKKYSWG